MAAILQSYYKFFPISNNRYDKDIGLKPSLVQCCEHFFYSDTIGIVMRGKIAQHPPFAIHLSDIGSNLILTNVSISLMDKPGN